MGAVPEDQRYSVITEKNPREIVLLRGNGCKWRKCRFCDYHMDFCMDQQENALLNHRVLSKVSGCYNHLEVINSGSFSDLPAETVDEIISICKDKKIKLLHFEAHWMHRDEIFDFKAKLERQGITVKMKIGVETFDELFRESYLVKGIHASPEHIAEYFDEVCLLQGIPGQTADSMKEDIETGLAFFERVCVNIMVKNTKPILPDKRVITQFMQEVYPIYKDNERVDILLNNTDFGVGV